MNRQSEAYRITLREYVRHIVKYKRLTIPGLLLPGIGSIFVFYGPPIVIARIITRFDQAVFSVADALPYIAVLGSVWMIGEILWRVAFVFLNKASAEITDDLYRYTMDRLLEKDPSFFQDNFAGSLTKKATGYGKNFDPFFATVSFSVVANIVPLIFALIILWTYSALLSVFLVACIAAVLVLILPRIKKRKRLVDRREEASNVMAGHIADVITNIDTVRAYAKEKDELSRHYSLSYDHAQKARKAWDYQNNKIHFVVSPLYVLINIIGLTLAIHFGSGSEQIATIFLVFSYYGTATRVMWEFSSIYKNIETNLSDAAQFTELLLDKPVITDPLHPEIADTHSGAIKFDKVNFTYDGNEKLFAGFNLQIAAGEKVALVGPSGGGKSTITKLLLRFADLDSGTIAIDDYQIDKISRASLRETISYVPQDPQMFHRSIAENIRYGNKKAKDTELVSVAKKAHAHDFIQSLPKSYDTLVGERGTKLSGGQRQRVAIARAMLKDAPILVLDEATSALDSESEKYIQDALWRLMGDKTAIVIAHRLSTIQKMDRIIVLDNGRIVEEGSHKELVKKKNGHYARLWKHQSGGFLED